MLEGVSEKERMGGLSFMRNGKLLVRVEGNKLLIRCAKDQTESLLEKAHTERYTMKGRDHIKGWLLIAPEGLATSKDLDYWVGISVAFNDRH